MLKPDHLGFAQAREAGENMGLAPPSPLLATCIQNAETDRTFISRTNLRSAEAYEELQSSQFCCKNWVWLGFLWEQSASNLLGKFTHKGRLSAFSLRRNNWR